MGLQRSPVFRALTRPQMFAGVTYSYFIINAAVTTEAFLITHSFIALPVALAVHVIGYFACLREPRIFDLWITKVSRCPRTRNWKRWGCNSYAPEGEDVDHDQMAGTGSVGQEGSQGRRPAALRLPRRRRDSALARRLAD